MFYTISKSISWISQSFTYAICFLFTSVKCTIHLLTTESTKELGLNLKIIILKFTYKQVNHHRIMDIYGQKVRDMGR